VTRPCIWPIGSKPGPSATSSDPGPAPGARGRARQLTDEQRAALAAYFSVYKGQEGGLARLALSQVSAANHPALDRAYDALRTAWVEARARARARAARPDLPGASCAARCRHPDCPASACARTASAPALAGCRRAHRRA